MRRFGPFDVVARLASGGAANIFLARRVGGLRSLVCLKTLLPERAADPEFVQMFLDEARLTARIHHPHAVEIYDLGREGHLYYIAMEFIAGETLWSLLSTVAHTRTPLPQLVVASLLANAAEALHAAHELTDDSGKPYNLVHRDVSPQNIMVSYEGQTKVLDFGVAKAETGRIATATGVVKGKFGYMSPEQITGGFVDRRTDIYSLGIVLFECLASRRLYRADAPEEVARLMLKGELPKLRRHAPDIDSALERVCVKALARNPNDRFQTAQELATALRDLLHGRRFPEGSAPIARLLEERFGERIAVRRRLFGQLLEGTVDEAELCQALGARPAMELDLTPLSEPPGTSLGIRPYAALGLETDENTQDSPEPEEEILIDAPSGDDPFSEATEVGDDVPGEAPLRVTEAELTEAVTDGDRSEPSDPDPGSDEPTPPSTPPDPKHPMNEPQLPAPTAIAPPSPPSPARVPHPLDVPSLPAAAILPYSLGHVLVALAIGMFCGLVAGLLVVLLRR